MKKVILIVIKVIIALILLCVLFIGGLLGWMEINDFKPEDKIVLKAEGTPAFPEGAPNELSLLCWNIGYAGLGKEQDFFMDGGTKTRPTLEMTQQYLQGITAFLSRHQSDVILLQEVDRDSRRSHRIDQLEAINAVLPDHAGVFAPNYLAPFIPYPPTAPLGRVNAGLATLSRYPFKEALRLALPGSYGWPLKLAYLDRCLIFSRHPAPNGKEWVIIHTHNNAYDASGNIRAAQLAFLKEMMLEEYNKGNYVIVAGDWNSLLPGADEEALTFTDEVPGFYLPLPDDFTPPGWQWLFDPKIPTNRSLASPYEKGKTYVTIIDGPIISPNLEAVEVETIEMGFSLSDHQPVQVRLRIK